MYALERNGRLPWLERPASGLSGTDSNSVRPFRPGRFGRIASARPLRSARRLYLPRKQRFPVGVGEGPSARERPGPGKGPGTGRVWVGGVWGGGRGALMPPVNRSKQERHRRRRGAAAFGGRSKRPVRRPLQTCYRFCNHFVVEMKEKEVVY